MVMRKQLLLIVLVLASRLIASGEDVRATASVDSNKILIGDWLGLHIDVQHASGTTVTWPAIPDSLEGLQIVHRNPPALKTEGNTVLESATFTITAFDSGLHVIPPLAFRYTLVGDTAIRSAETAPIPVFVRGIVVDTTLEIKDVKPPLGIPISFAELLPYIIGVIVLGGIIWLIYYVNKKRKRGESLIPEAPPRPAHEIALEALHALEAERVWQRGKVKEYYSQLTDIVRTYIERSYRILAMEMTTDEILASPEIREMPAECTGMLKEILVRADLVKFAKMQPMAAENESSLSLAQSYVQQTSAPAKQPGSVAALEEVTS
jgi:hypothetical protein